MSCIVSETIQLRPSIKLFNGSLPDHYRFLDNNPGRLKIEIHHPGYSPVESLLLTLYAWDHPEGGLHYNFVKCVCIIIANNQEGYLSSERDGAAIEAEGDSALRGPRYWYHVRDPDNTTNSSYRWPVVASFHNWKSPLTIPQAFRRGVPTQFATNTGSSSTFSASLRLRDVTCRITQCDTSLETAHLCPKSEQDWYMANSMFQWNTNPRLTNDNMINDLSNVMLLRSDLHKAFDARKFVVFPKSETEWVVHVLEITGDMAKLYHNTILHSIPHCRLEFLYARFAWAIFPSLSGFVKPFTVRKVVVAEGTNNGIEYVIKNTSNHNEAYANIFRQPKTTKRPRPTEEDPTEENHESREKMKGYSCNEGDQFLDFISDSTGRISTCHDKSSIPTNSPSPAPSQLPSQTTLPRQPPSHAQTSLYLPDPSEPTAYSEYNRLILLKEQYLQSRRPPNYHPLSPESLDKIKDPKEKMLALGADIIDDWVDE